MDRVESQRLYHELATLRHATEDCIVVSIGARGPNMDMPEGNAVATIRMGDEEASAEAKYLMDAITLARAKIIRAREAKKAKKEKEKRDA